VNVISKRGLMEMAKAKRLDSDTVTEIDAWCRTSQAATWQNLQDVRKVFPGADQVGTALVFNVRHNRYRLIVFAVYPKQKLYVKALLTHEEYDREAWKKWA
jgi:mRNA interferase HigB